MIDYVVGFAFSRDKKDVVLIHKLKPSWQLHKLNGIGGKMTADDLDEVEAMVREFEEETGVKTEPQMWQTFAVLTFEPDVVLFCLRMFSNAIYQCKTVEKEEVVRMAVDTALGEFRYPLIPNLKVLLPMALDEDFQYAEIKAIFR